jgi:hypothetical protein
MLKEKEKFNSHLSYEEIDNLPGMKKHPVVAESGYIDPDHYKNRKHEVFDVMRDTQTYERHIGYLEGCVIKYMMRWDKKHDDPLMDLHKAKRYLEQLIQTIESEEEQHAMVSNGEQVGTDNFMQHPQTGERIRTVGRTIKW